MTDALTHTTVYTYDVAGRLSEMQDARGNVTTYAYDALGRRTVVTDADGVAIYSIYDAAGRLVETRDELDNSTRYGYDALGSREVMANARGYATRYEYDGVGRLITVTENYTTTPVSDHQTNVQTKYAYDVSGNLIAVTDALTNTTVYTYDLTGRRIAEKDGEGNVTRYVYDGHGRRVKEVYPGSTGLTTGDASGPITVATAHNALGWPTQIEYPAVGETPGFTVEYSYNGLGHRDTVTDATGAITYNYDALYQPLAIGAPTGEGSGEPGRTTQYLYDAAGRRTHLVYPSGETVTYTHDAANRLLMVTDWEGGKTVYTYTAAGRLSEMRLPNDVETRYDYDGAGRLVKIEHRSEGETLAQYEYELDSVGNRVAVTETLTPLAEGYSAALLDKPDTLGARNTADQTSSSLSSSLWRSPGLAASIPATVSDNPVHIARTLEPERVSRHTTSCRGANKASVAATIRYVSTTGSNSGDCTNPASPCATIQYTVDRAGDGDEIRAAAGLYTGVNSYGGLAQVVYISKTITVRGRYTTTNWTTSDPEANPTTLDAQEQGRVLYITGISPTIEGLRITGGHAGILGGTPTGRGYGGGVLLYRSRGATLSSNIISGNAAILGGGVFLYRYRATFTSNIISGNSALDGGGLYIRGAHATLSDNTIDDNTARRYGGGAVRTQ